MCLRIGVKTCPWSVQSLPARTAPSAGSVVLKPIFPEFGKPCDSDGAALHTSASYNIGAPDVREIASGEQSQDCEGFFAVRLL